MQVYRGQYHGISDLVILHVRCNSIIMERLEQRPGIGIGHSWGICDVYSYAMHGASWESYHSTGQS